MSTGSVLKLCLKCIFVLCFGLDSSMRLCAQQSKSATSAKDGKNLPWSPPDIDAQIPTNMGEMACPLQSVLEQAGARAVELTRTLENFTALEEIRYQRNGPDDHVEESDSSTFDYNFGFENHGAGRSTQEYRTPAKGGHTFPSSTQDVGLVAMALIFLPGLQSDYEMTCEALIKWHDQPAYLIGFEQRRDKPGRTLRLRSDKGTYPVMLRGRAWISAENSQVLHMEIKSMEAVHACKLRSAAIAIDYGAVQIRSLKIELWLPHAIDAYWEYENYRVILLHRFTNFQAFSVDTLETVKPPKTN